MMEDGGWKIDDGRWMMEAEGVGVKVNKIYNFKLHENEF